MSVFFLFCMTAAAGAVFFCTLSGIGTADTGYTFLFFSAEIEDDAGRDADENSNNDNISHNSVIFQRVCCFLLVLWISTRMNAAMARIAMRPAAAAPIFSASPVTTVPMV